MEKEITNEIKAKIFAQYLGQNILIGKTIQGAKIVTGFTISVISAGESPSLKLLVTPLSKITDEDAIEVAKMACYEIQNEQYDEIHTTNKICKAGRRIDLMGRTFFSVWFTKHGIARCIVQIYENGDVVNQINNDGYFKFQPTKNQCKIHQYLQSKGYAMPYLDYSVEDLVRFGVYQLSE